MKLLISLANVPEKRAAKIQSVKVPADLKKPVRDDSEKPVSTEAPVVAAENEMEFNFDESADLLAHKALERTPTRSRAKMRLNVTRILKAVKPDQRNFRGAMMDLEDPRFK